MKITINKPDALVLVDGVAFAADVSQLPSYLRVVQWDSEANEGWIEFVNDGRGVYLPNQKIVDFTAFNYLKEAWDVAKAADDAAIAAHVAELAARAS